MTEPVRLVDKRYRIDPEESLVTWTGSSPIGSHTGNLAISEGELTIERGQLTGGRVVIDMTSITNADLQHDYRKVLIAHLLSGDFFEVERYPSAEARLNGWRPIPAAPPGAPNYEIDADLTIKAITHPVSFAALITPQPGCVKAEATLKIDRTRWNVTYGSEKLLLKFGRHLVDDLITLEFFLVAV